MEKSYKEYLQNINTFVFDVDGVLTDGSLLVTTDGELLRSMNVKDGFAIKTAIDNGFNICIISGGSNSGVKRRLEVLGVESVHLGVKNKSEVLDNYLSTRGISNEQVLYMGDDIPDVAVMQKTALPCCPQDAVPEVKHVSKYISHKNGGKGCVRDVIEQVLKVQGCWPKIHE